MNATLMKDLDSQSDESQDQEQNLIDHFQKMLIRPQLKQECTNISVLSINEDSEELIYELFVFIFLKDTTHWNYWNIYLNDCLQTLKIKNKSIHFSRPKNQFIIAKVLVSQENCKKNFTINLIIIEFKLLTKQKEFYDEGQKFSCIFMPSFFLQCKIDHPPIVITKRKRQTVVISQQNYVFPIGKILDFCEQVEYKSYNAQYLLQNQEPIIKHICAYLNSSFLNDQFISGKIIIGVSIDKISRKPRVTGLKCSQRTAELIVCSLRENLNHLKIQENMVSIQIGDCGVIDNTKEEVFIIDKLKMIQIKVYAQTEQFYAQQHGDYKYRYKGHIENVPLTILYQAKQNKKINEDEFIQSLNYRDQLENSQKLELLDFKKQSHSKQIECNGAGQNKKRKQTEKKQ